MRTVRDWVFVEDHCRAIATVLELGRRGETYKSEDRTKSEHRDRAYHLRSGRLDRADARSVSQICEILLTIGAEAYNKEGTKYLQSYLRQGKEA